MSTGLYHACGQIALLTSITAGAQLAISKYVDKSEDIFHTFHKYNITNAFLIPTELTYLVKNSHIIDKQYIKCLQNVFTAGAPLSQHIYKQLMDKFSFEKFRTGTFSNYLDKKFNIFNKLYSNSSLRNV